jgi:hypothetical protein
MERVPVLLKNEIQTRWMGDMSLSVGSNGAERSEGQRERGKGERGKARDARGSKVRGGRESCEVRGVSVGSSVIVMRMMSGGDEIWCQGDSTK